MKISDTCAYKTRSVQVLVSWPLVSMYRRFFGIPIGWMHPVFYEHARLPLWPLISNIAISVWAFGL